MTRLDLNSLLSHSMENKGESLPSPISSGSSGKKSTRKEEQYRQMFSELEKYVVAHSSNSSKPATAAAGIGEATAASTTTAGDQRGCCARGWRHGAKKQYSRMQRAAKARF